MAAEQKPIGGGFDPNAFAEAVAKAVAEATVRVEERIRPIERTTPSRVSAFNPEGLAVRPKLARRVIFAGGELNERSMTNAEIDAVNKLTVTGDFHRNQWKVRIRRDGSDKETVYIELPTKELDQRMELPPSLTAAIEEILTEAKARPKVA